MTVLCRQSRIPALTGVLGMQTWDVNKAAPESLGGPFNLILASNAVHTCDNMAGELAHLRIFIPSQE